MRDNPYEQAELVTRPLDKVLNESKDEAGNSENIFSNKKKFHIKKGKIEILNLEEIADLKGQDTPRDKPIPKTTPRKTEKDPIKSNTPGSNRIKNVTQNIFSYNHCKSSIFNIKADPTVKTSLTRHKERSRNASQYNLAKPVQSDIRVKNKDKGSKISASFNRPTDMDLRASPSCKVADMIGKPKEMIYYGELFGPTRTNTVPTREVSIEQPRRITEIQRELVESKHRYSERSKVE